MTLFSFGGLDGLQTPLHDIQVKDAFSVLNGHELAHPEDAAWIFVDLWRVDQPTLFEHVAEPLLSSVAVMAKDVFR